MAEQALSESLMLGPCRKREVHPSTLCRRPPWPTGMRVVARVVCCVTPALDQWLPGAMLVCTSIALWRMCMSTPGQALRHLVAGRENPAETSMTQPVSQANTPLGPTTVRTPRCACNGWHSWPACNASTSRSTAHASSSDPYQQRVRTKEVSAPDVASPDNGLSAHPNVRSMNASSLSKSAKTTSSQPYDYSFAPRLPSLKAASKT
jgi:hypothetical protein